MKKILLTLMLVLSIAVLAGCDDTPDDPDDEETPTESTYLNPVWAPVLADPSVIRHEGTYYAFGTQDYGQWGEDDFGVRYTPILSSADLVTWTYATSAFTMQTRPIWGTPNAGLWAPDIVKIGDTFNLYYSLSTWGDPNPGIGVATASHPLGPWTDQGPVLRSLDIGVNNSIDPTVFEANGSIYMIWGSFRGIYGIELTADGLSAKDGDNARNTKVLLAGLDTSFGWNAATYEAPYILYKDGYYYMFVSSGTCCDGHNSTYNVRVGRSESPMGPYVGSDGRSMLGTYRGHQVLMGSSRFKGPGHNSIAIDDAGHHYIVYHAFDTNEDPAFGNSPRRSMLIDLLHWDALGWPTTNATMPSNLAKDKPVIND
ncbi:MAG: family 43 glycosylhydrolase [Acholeplasmataceae bacterium]|nr:family 43 glycosylhydrolase [Acholeplasmataceae bacterium]